MADVSTESAGAGKQVQDALATSEARMHALLAAAVDGIISIDERGLIQLVNPAAERMFGYSAHELIGKNVSLLIPSPYREEHDGYLARYLGTGEKRIIGISREVEGLRKDGTSFPTELSVAEVRTGRERIFLGILRDISERKRTEERLRLVVESTPNAILMVNAEGNIVLVNSQAEKYFGYRREELIGQAVEILVPERFRAKHPDYRESFFTSPSARPMGVGRDLYGRRKDGSEFPVEIGLTPIETREGLLVLSAIVDITERKRAEEVRAQLSRELAEKNKEMENIVYAVSHDLRAPLVNVQGFSRELGATCRMLQGLLARQGALAPDQVTADEAHSLVNKDIPEALGFIQASVAKMDALLSGLLQVSRLGRALLTPARVDMNGLLAEIRETLEYALKQAGATLAIEPLPACWGDAGHLNQVFSNLLDNAVKYLDRARAGRLVVTGRVEDAQAIYVVEDNGIGIAPAHQAKIFEIFHRLEPSVGSGEGLGLTIVQRIVERHGGRVWVESKPAEGSRFHVALPRAPTTRSDQ